MPEAAPLGPLLRLAMPMVLSRATQVVMTFADVLMVEHLGPGSIAASASGGFNVFLWMILPMGTVFIVQSFVSQLAGRGEYADTPRYAWYGLAIATIAGLLGLAFIPFIGPALTLTDYSPAVQAEMTSYMTIRMFSVTGVVAVEALGNWYGGLGNTWMGMIASTLMMCSDLFLNWVLIYGNLGAPEMGVDGAALSTTIGCYVGTGFLVIMFWRRRGTPKVPRGEAKPLSLSELGRVVRFGLPNGINWFFEFAAFQMFVNFMLAGLGDDTVAALNVVIAINSISFMPAFGLASAGAILAGNAIGAGDKDGVWPHVKTTLICTMIWMGFIGSFYFIIPEQLLALFDSEGDSPRLVEIGIAMLGISAAWQLFDAIGITLSETLRAAGDTTWTAGARLVLAWAVFMPAAYLVVDVWGGGPSEAMACLVGYLGLLSGAFALRFKSGAWRKIELIEPKLV